MRTKRAVGARHYTSKPRSIKEHVQRVVHARHRSDQKSLVLKPYHARPYRKRHVSVLAAALMACFILFGLAISWTVASAIGRQDAWNFFSQLLQLQPSKQTVSSTLGFSFTFTPGQFYIGAINSADGKLYVGKEVNTARPYQTFKLSSSAIHDNTQPASITVDYLPDPVAGKTVGAVEQQYVIAPNANHPTRADSTSTTISGHTFIRTLWNQPVTGAFAKQLSMQFVTYTTVWQGHPLIIRTDNRLVKVQSFEDIDALAQTVTLQPSQLGFVQSDSIIKLASANHTLLDSLSYASLAAATTASPQLTTSQLISALYSPAVVKIYNVYCTDVLLAGKPFVRNYCNALTGSGFFISENGYIATNGHVATSSSKDIVLQSAIAEIYTNGDTSYLETLALLGGLSGADLGAISDPNVFMDTICNAVYNLPDSLFTQTNNVSNLLVDLTNDDPDVNTLLSDTKALKAYPESAKVKHATVIGSDYRAIDGLVKYRQSDVAIIKVQGSHYPVVSLGSISEISQGSNLNILGYPGAAQDNGIVSGVQDSVTLTSGKVSAIKNANGDSRKLIQTDTTIGHGNSGGPALDDNGDVVGIATYSVDQSGQGGGVFNYVRDIADTKALATKLHVPVGQQGELQQAWQQAITAFYSSHYSKSLTYFNTVKSLDPVHPTVDTFIANAKEAIKEGKDIVDFPIWLVFVGAGACLVVAAGAALVIVRHHAKHKVYQVMTGQTAVNSASVGSQSLFAAPQYQQPVSPPQVPQSPLYYRQQGVQPQARTTPSLASIPATDHEPQPYQQLNSTFPPAQVQTPAPTPEPVQQPQVAYPQPPPVPNPSASPQVFYPQTQQPTQPFRPQ